jgi:hypothetical protein
MSKLHSGARACRRGSLEIIIRPENGRLSSKIRKIVHDADSAKRERQVKTVKFKSENRLKLANMMTIHGRPNGARLSGQYDERLVVG